MRSWIWGSVLRNAFAESLSRSLLVRSLDDFYVAYQINAYTRLPHRQAGLYSQLHQHIQEEFARAGVEIMSPHYRATRTGAEAGSTIPPLPSEAPAPAVQPQARLPTIFQNRKD